MSAWIEMVDVDFSNWIILGKSSMLKQRLLQIMKLTQGF